MERVNQRRQAAADMRQRLVAAAIGQFADHGLAGVTHRKVEQRAGVSQGLVKHHFTTLDGLLEAVVDHLADVDVGSVMVVTAEQHYIAQATGVVPQEVWQAAEQTWREINRQPELVRARFELYLHASRRPELHAAILRGRERFIAAVQTSLPDPQPRAGARLVLAMVDGLLIQQLAAPEEEIDQLAPTLLLTAAAATAGLPA